MMLQLGFNLLGFSTIRPSRSFSDSSRVVERDRAFPVKDHSECWMGTSQRSHGPRLRR